MQGLNGTVCHVATIGDAIRTIREHTGLTQTAFGQRIGASNVRLGKIERSETEPTFKLLGKIRECYGYCPLALLVLADDTVELAWHRHLLRGEKR